MVGAIEDITVKQGIQPSQAVLIGGGGAGGLNAVAVGRRLGCRAVLIPETGAALSAAGALMSELTSEYARLSFMTSSRFDLPRAMAVLADLAAECRAFIEDGPGKGAVATEIEYSVEARYPQQVWEIEVPLSPAGLRQPAGVAELVADFHRVHNETFAISDPGSQIEIIAWRARVRCRLLKAEIGTLRTADDDAAHHHDRRRAYFPGSGWTDIEVIRFERFPPGTSVVGPAIVESSFTTVVLEPGASARRTAGGGLSITPFDRQQGCAP
jgi:N-methylhydantoinase A